MADISLATQVAPATPSSGNVVIWADTNTKRFVQTNDVGEHIGILYSRDSITSQGPGFAADTYVTDSGLLIPSFGMRARQTYNWVITGTKTAAGVAAAVITIRIGTLQTVADTARLVLTANVIQTAALSGGVLTVTLNVRNVGAAGVIAGGFGWAASAGFGGGASAVSASFDNSNLAGQFVGLSINGGTAAAWTINSVQGEISN